MSIDRVRLALSAPPATAEAYRAALPEALEAEGVPFIWDDAAPDFVVYAPQDDDPDWGRWPDLKGVLSLWAGVERIVGRVPPHLPLVRMIEPGLRQGMVEYVTAAVLRHHLGEWPQDGVWRNDRTPPLTTGRPVTVLGLGELGMACAAALASLGFPVTGWARRQGSTGPLARRLSGPVGEALDGAEGVVTLLPLTDDTRHILNAASLARLAPGAFVVNPGRGPLIDDAALLAALETGQIGGATLDVFATEPLPPGHPYWAHPRVTVTPHVAAATRVPTAAAALAANLARWRRGEAMVGIVDRAAGY